MALLFSEEVQLCHFGRGLFEIQFYEHILNLEQ